FFFQAEDGIRAKLVTGVQTCALPIFGDALDADVPHPLADRLLELGDALDRDRRRPQPHEGTAQILAADVALEAKLLGMLADGARSEERRVGKECRGRGGRERGDKKTG